MCPGKPGCAVSWIKTIKSSLTFLDQKQDALCSFITFLSGEVSTRWGCHDITSPPCWAFLRVPSPALHESTMVLISIPRNFQGSIYLSVRYRYRYTMYLHLNLCNCPNKTNICHLCKCCYCNHCTTVHTFTYSPVILCKLIFTCMKLL